MTKATGYPTKTSWGTLTAIRDNDQIVIMCRDSKQEEYEFYHSNIDHVLGDPYYKDHMMGKIWCSVELLDNIIKLANT